MKLIKIFLRYLNLKSKKIKISQSLDIENNFKFSKGDWVVVCCGRWPYSLKNPTAKVIGLSWQSSTKQPIYIVELYGGVLRLSESDLKHQNKDDEMDWKLKQLLK